MQRGVKRARADELPSTVSRSVVAQLATAAFFDVHVARLAGLLDRRLDDAKLTRGQFATILVVIGHAFETRMALSNDMLSTCLGVVRWLAVDRQLAQLAADTGVCAAIVNGVLTPLQVQVSTYGVTDVEHVASVQQLVLAYQALMSVLCTLRSATETVWSSASDDTTTIHAKIADKARAGYTTIAAATAANDSRVLCGMVKVASAMFVDAVTGVADPTVCVLGSKARALQQEVAACALRCYSWLCQPAGTGHACAHCAMSGDVTTAAAAAATEEAKKLDGAAVDTDAVRLCLDVLNATRFEGATTNMTLAAAQVLRAALGNRCTWDVLRRSVSTETLHAVLNNALSQTWVRSLPSSTTVLATPSSTPGGAALAAVRCLPLHTASMLRSAQRETVLELMYAMCVAFTIECDLHHRGNIAEAWSRLVWALQSSSLPGGGFSAVPVLNVHLAAVRMLHHKLRLHSHFDDVRPVCDDSGKDCWGWPQVAVPAHLELLPGTLRSWDASWLGDVSLLLNVVLRCHLPLLVQALPKPVDAQATAAPQPPAAEAEACVEQAAAVRVVTAAVWMLCEVLACIAADDGSRRMPHVAVFQEQLLDVVVSVCDMAPTLLVAAHINVVRLVATLVSSAGSDSGRQQLWMCKALPGFTHALETTVTRSQSQSSSLQPRLQTAFKAARALLCEAVDKMSRASVAAECGCKCDCDPECCEQRCRTALYNVLVHYGSIVPTAPP